MAVNRQFEAIAPKYNEMLSYRRETARRVRYSFYQKWKIGTGRQYFTDIIGLSSTTVI